VTWYERGDLSEGPGAAIPDQRGGSRPVPDRTRSALRHV